MKRQPHHLIGISLAMAFALAICSPVQSQSAEVIATKDAAAKPASHCQEMKEQKQKLQEDIKAQDAQLTEHLTEMNRAPQDKKVDLMAAVLTRIVEQRIAMDARKAKMEEEMMQHMMQHKQMGGRPMPDCPMMKGMDDNSGDAHKEHPAEQK